MRRLFSLSLIVSKPKLSVRVTTVESDALTSRHDHIIRMDDVHRAQPAGVGVGAAPRIGEHKTGGEDGKTPRLHQLLLPNGTRQRQQPQLVMVDAVWSQIARAVFDSENQRIAGLVFLAQVKITRPGNGQQGPGMLDLGAATPPRWP